MLFSLIWRQLERLDTTSHQSFTNTWKFYLIQNHPASLNAPFFPPFPLSCCCLPVPKAAVPHAGVPQPVPAVRHGEHAPDHPQRLHHLPADASQPPARCHQGLVPQGANFSTPLCRSTRWAWLSFCNPMKSVFGLCQLWFGCTRTRPCV